MAARFNELIRFRIYTRAPMSPTSATRYWLPPLLWTAVIFAASSDHLSSTQSAPWLEALVQAILGHPLPPAHFETIHFIIRKAGHLTEYGILGALLFRALRGDHRIRWNIGWAAGGVTVATIVAVFDEWHQMYVPSRTASSADIAVDALGALLAQVLIRVAQRK